MRIVFFGTPEFAVPTLNAVAEVHDVVLVVAQPDRPAGRGMKLHKPPVIARAEELRLEVAQPAKIRTEEFLSRIVLLAPDLGIVVAYGRILPPRLLEIPAHGFLNIHASLLPKYRGAAPIQRAIEAGEATTGATIMRVDEELDHGPILAVAPVEIGPDERLPAVALRLAVAGAATMVDVLRRMERGDWTETEQDHTRATHAPKIEKEEGRVTFTEPARVIYNRFRAFDPWPGVFFESGGQTVRITEMRLERETSGGPPRTIVEMSEAIVVATGAGAIRLLQLQRPGKPRAAAADVARGLGWRAGAVIP